MKNLNLEIKSIKVSSVLNRNTREYGKKHLIDGNLETCWNSDQGSPQHIIIDFNDPLCINKIEFTFQGGFVGKTAEIYAFENENPLLLETVHPLDSNALQAFPLKNQKSFLRYKINFPASTDFYGRITLYSLSLLGPE
ncbi:hypothetical protein BB560_001634 [Smittium megazygosporum]|uniref:F5/8 type C domain-containing protein n=1 Tax=Smittium megazygosporum TaxID=133381 RepID=A0A2T9ZGZ1_9FUNG|nr:hypothetical protein BB560_001634 [Smittium megazygosporum]